MDVWKGLLDEIMNTRPADVMERLREMEEQILAERTRLEQSAKALEAQQKVLTGMRLSIGKTNGDTFKEGRTAYHKLVEFRRSEILNGLKMLAESQHKNIASIAEISDFICSLKGIRSIARRRVAIGVHLSVLAKEGFVKRIKERKGYWEINTL